FPSEKWIEHKILLLAERRPLNQYQLPAILRINYAKTARFTRASETAPFENAVGVLGKPNEIALAQLEPVDVAVAHPPSISSALMNFGMAADRRSNSARVSRSPLSKGGMASLGAGLASCSSTHEAIAAYSGEVIEPPHLETTLNVTSGQLRQ
ncbi:MAG TPA: hypothetical protein VMV69_16400, partial [Pirellulales bacterium]|nr:hypothetical protein [Pirellulales bacterium]